MAMGQQRTAQCQTQSPAGRKSFSRLLSHEQDGGGPAARRPMPIWIADARQNARRLPAPKPRPPSTAAAIMLTERSWGSTSTNRDEK